jgi:acylphosphatase
VPELSDADHTTKRVRVLVSGDVRGVGFRWFCREQAMGAGVTGFVRNLTDGRVEAAFEGEPAAVDAMVVWCHQGSSWARVTSVEVADQAPRGDEHFEITR